jgi:hypothetical protein
VIITKIRLANSAAIRLPECVLVPEIRLSPDSAESYQEADLACFLDYRSVHSGAERIFSAVGSGKDDVPQSGKSKNLHQPFGLMSPATTWHELGGRNRVQAAQARPPLGRS